MQRVKALLLSLVFVVSTTITAETASFPLVKLETTQGNIILKLRTDEAPKTCENFLRYVREGYYNDTLFHRIIDGFLIQGGGFDASYNIKRTYPPIRNESSETSLKNKRGTVGMALTTNPHSATTQFYINAADNPLQDYTKKRKHGFTVFAEVIDGMKTVDKIKKVRTRRITVYSELYKREVLLHDAPQRDIIIKTATVLRD